MFLHKQAGKLTFAELILEKIKGEIMGQGKLLPFLKERHLLVMSPLAASSAGFHIHSCYVNSNDFYFVNPLW